MKNALKYVEYIFLLFDSCVSVYLRPRYTLHACGKKKGDANLNVCRNQKRKSKRKKWRNSIGLVCKYTEIGLFQSAVMDAKFKELEKCVVHQIPFRMGIFVWLPRWWRGTCVCVLVRLVVVEWARRCASAFNTNERKFCAVAFEQRLHFIKRENTFGSGIFFRSFSSGAIVLFLSLPSRIMQLFPVASAAHDLSYEKLKQRVSNHFQRRRPFASHFSIPLNP